MKEQNKSSIATRASGIELLKIIAIFMIVINHVVQTLTTDNLGSDYQDYVINISRATTDVQTMILMVLRHFGTWGNSLFLVCSMWFLLKSSRCKKKKCFLMILEIWSVSIIILIMTFGLLKGRITAEVVHKCFFPTLYANNWYMTCYLLFYPIHPILNGIIERMSQKELFRSAVFLAGLYIFLDFIRNDWFFPSILILWVTIYFVVAYVQKYLMKYVDNIKLNLIVLMINFIGLVGIILVTNFAGLHFPSWRDKVMCWRSECNPFIIFMSISMLNLARSIHFKNRLINWISSLSMLIYIIHENLILRMYFRPVVWTYIYKAFGHAHVVRWTFIFSGFVFVFGVVSAAIYFFILKRLVDAIGDKLYNFFKKIYLGIENKSLKL